MRLFLSVVSILMVGLGAGWLFAPETMLGWWSAQSDAAGVYMSRRYGGLLFGYAAILWRCRSAGPSAGRTAILGGGAFVTTLVALLSLWGVVTGIVGPGAWAAVVVEAALAGGFLRYFLAERAQAPGEASS